MDIKDLEITLNNDNSQIDMFAEKAYRLVELAKEAKTLANDLASIAGNLGINVYINS